MEKERGDERVCREEGGGEEEEAGGDRGKSHLCQTKFRALPSSVSSNTQVEHKQNALPQVSAKDTRDTHE